MEIHKIVIIGNLLANPKIPEQIRQEYPVFTCDDCHWYKPYPDAKEGGEDEWEGKGDCGLIRVLRSEVTPACKDFRQASAYEAGIVVGQDSIY